jgi:preprotein translocase SecF subunit
MAALITLVPADPKLNFLGKRTLCLAFSAFLVIGSLVAFAVQGLNFGVDFRGGILMEVETAEPADVGALRAELGGLGLGEVTLQEFGGPDVLLINVSRQDGGEEEQRAAIEEVQQVLGERVEEYRRIEFVGPKVGAELRQAGILATVLALAAIGVYIWLRFEWQFGLAALVALAHDVIATVGFFAVTQIEFNLATLAAVLTIAGYSINDTVVVFDRVREMLRKYKKMPMAELLNMAVNKTLSRTLLTSVTTLLALVALAVFGGEVIRGFTSGLIWGVVIGTYSSVALAIPLLYYMGMRRDQIPGGDDGEDAKASDAGAVDKAAKSTT